MRKLYFFLTILMVGCWLYVFTSCGQSVKYSKVLKQVKVSVSVANLRTGPGTDYGYVLSGDETPYQVSRGTILDVVGEENGWYEVLLNGTDKTAFIKQTLCGKNVEKTKRRVKKDEIQGKEGVTIYKDVLPEERQSSAETHSESPASSTGAADDDN